jgi:energy-coupling factor transporter ATP-binding protein EcfA2
MSDDENVPGGIMEPVDLAHQRFRSLRIEVSDYVHSITTEADTRLKVIDRVFTEVLLWPHCEILTEPPVPTGFADYAFLVGGKSRLITEAKRDGRSFGVEGRQPGRGYKLSGGVFTNSDAREGITQAIRYCGEKSAELACVTNGREWIIFRGSRLGDGVDIRDGVAFVFPNLVAIEDSFNLFYNLLSYENASKFGYRSYFQEAEGQPIRMTVFHRSLRPAGSARFLPVSGLAADIEKILSTFFRRLAGDQDPELLDACFVETRESYYAEGQIARMAENIVVRLRELETGQGDALTGLIERVRQTQRHEFVLLVGIKGAGKSTFVTRFFNSVLPAATRKHCVMLKVDMGMSPGDAEGVVDWLNRAIIKQAEADLFDGAPSYAEIQGMFFDEYKRLSKGPLAGLYETNKDEFRIKFGEYVEEIRRSEPHEYIQGLLRHIVNSRLMLPILVFDNADHFNIEFQQRVYQYARSLYEPTLCLVVLPITDRTSWQLSKHGALQSFEHEAFFLPAPPTEQIIRKRIEFLGQQVQSERSRPEDRYFIGKGISLSIDDLDAFSRSLQRIFLQTSNVSTWIGALANYNVRQTLKLARMFVSSPHLRVVDLLQAYVAGDAFEVHQSRAAKALIRGNYDIYPSRQHEFVQNVFSLNEDLETTPLLGVRILQLLSDVPVREREGALIEVDEIIVYCAGMNIENRAVNLWLDSLLKSGLILSYDPTVQDIGDAGQVEISPTGRQHLYWATGNFEYLSAMADVTPLLSETTFAQMQEDIRAKVAWQRKTATFIEYLLTEDGMYCLMSDHKSYDSQRRVRATLEMTGRRLREMVARAEELAEQRRRRPS